MPQTYSFSEMTGSRNEETWKLAILAFQKSDAIEFPVGRPLVYLPGSKVGCAFLNLQNRHPASVHIDIDNWPAVALTVSP